MSTQQLDAITCPACQRRFPRKPGMAGKSVRCTCGQVFAVPADPPPPPPQPAKADGWEFGSESEVAAKTKQVVFIITSLPLIGLLFAGGQYLWQRSRAEATRVNSIVVQTDLPPLAPVSALDEHVAEMTEKYGSEEVMQWLSERDSRGVVGFEWTREKTQKVAQMWYDHGAKTVLAFGKLATTELAIELPDDKTKRPYFFDYVRNNFPAYPRAFPGGVAPVPGSPFNGLAVPGQHDVGQKYVVIVFLSGPLADQVLKTDELTP